MSYFGYLNKDLLINKTTEELGNYFVELNLYEINCYAKGNVSNIKDGVIELRYNPNELVMEPKEKLVDEFYSFIKDLYNYEINSGKFTFFESFNNEIYGLDFADQKRNALSHFLKIYNETYIDVITFFDEKISDNGITHTTSHSKFKMLHAQQKSFKTNLINEVKLTQYLIGNKDFFNKESLSTKYLTITDTILFETWLQILIELNDRFNFEEDLYFTQIRFDKEKFKKYNHIFKTLLSYQFTNNKIKSFSEDHKAHIESLYQVLLVNDSIYNHKENFMEFLKIEYDLIISKIISYDKNINYSHDERVTLFCSELSNLTSKKEQN